MDVVTTWMPVLSKDQNLVTYLFMEGPSDWSNL